MYNEGLYQTTDRDLYTIEKRTYLGADLLTILKEQNEVELIRQYKEWKVLPDQIIELRTQFPEDKIESSSSYDLEVRVPNEETVQEVLKLKTHSWTLKQVMDKLQMSRKDIMAIYKTNLSMLKGLKKSGSLKLNNTLSNERSREMTRKLLQADLGKRD